MGSLPNLSGHRIRVVTGRSMGPWIEARAGELAASTGAEVEVVVVTNHYFGDGVTVAGLLGGQDMRAALGEPRPEDIILLPGEALNADQMFVDDYPLDRLRSELMPAKVFTGHEITRMLTGP